MNITILSVTTETVPTAKGSYQKAEVAYKDEGGKVSGKKIMSFTNQKVFDIIKGCTGGETLSITAEKDDKGYWQWVDASKEVDGSISNKTTALPAPKSTYETPEERAKKQVYIVRQSSITNAIAFSQGVKALKSVEDVIKTAKQFEAYVFDIAVEDSIESLKGDKVE